jgi:ATP-binding protein involved in chromosome partitioning
MLETALRGVLDPELGVDLVELGMVRGALIDGAVARIDLALTVASCPRRKQIEDEVRQAAAAVPGVQEVEITVAAMTAEQRSRAMATARRHSSNPPAVHSIGPRTRVIAVGSGKGGVGKSSISVNLALALADAGLRVGLLDADIWGYSIPRMLGLIGNRLETGPERTILPLETSGLAVISVGLMLDDEDTALMWRGPMLSKALEQLLRDVAWDPALDYLIIDLPPGTGDVQLSLARLLPQAAMVVVTTPQTAASKVAARLADMACRSALPVVGIIENMAGFTAEDGRHYPVFGSGGGAALADELGAPLLAQVPIDPLVAEGGDEGRPVVRACPGSPAASAIILAADRLIALLPPCGKKDSG